MGCVLGGAEVERFLVGSTVTMYMMQDGTSGLDDKASCRPRSNAAAGHMVACMLDIFLRSPTLGMTNLKLVLQDMKVLMVNLCTRLTP
jgi:hypothetical protein